jgi:hypothetical protein
MVNDKGDQMFIESVSFNRVWYWINVVWAKSFAAAAMLLIGLYIGEMNAESRMVADCKFAGAFRVGIQAFTCQRRI